MDKLRKLHVTKIDVRKILAKENGADFIPDDILFGTENFLIFNRNS